MGATPSQPKIYKPPSRFDVLRWPLVGPLLRWRWGRLLFQAALLLVALVAVYDGFTGPQLAPRNSATVLVWLHYRGIIVLLLLLAGNFFCMGCPFTLPRTLARKVAGNGRRWPRFLRNKWLAIGLLVFYFFLYEWLDLWASPVITAWLILGYFGASFVLEAIFAESPFCKHVCPLGTFNFISATISPTQIQVHSQDVCRDCQGKECLKGSADVLGCGTKLFAPQIQSNMDCVFCLDCVRACPYDNVGLFVRSPLQEMKTESWRRRWDLAMLVLVFTAAALSNAFGMVPPIFVLEGWLANTLGLAADGAISVWEEGLVLLLIFGVLNGVLPVGFGLGVAWISRRLAHGARRLEPLRVALARYVPALVPLTFAIWLAHYGFHFATGALSIVPVMQFLLADLGWPVLGEPNWLLGPVLPLSWLTPLELVITVVGLAVSLYVVGERSKLGGNGRAAPLREQLPWILLLVAIALAAVALFNLPMEMRGTSFMN